MDNYQVVHLHLCYKYLTIQNVITMTAHTSDDLCMLDAYTVARLLSVKNMFKSPATPIITSNDAQENVPDE